jgi:hypothetical protein
MEPSNPVRSLQLTLISLRSIRATGISTCAARAFGAAGGARTCRLGASCSFGSASARSLSSGIP